VQLKFGKSDVAIVGITDVDAVIRVCWAEAVDAAESNTIAAVETALIVFFLLLEFFDRAI